MNGVLYVCGAIATIAAAIAIINKLIKSYLDKHLKTFMETYSKVVDESTNKKIDEVQDAMDKRLDIIQKTVDVRLDSLQHALEAYQEESIHNDETLKSASIATIRDRINQSYNFYATKTCIGAHTLFTLEELYKAYVANGGNSFAKSQMEYIRSLKVIPDDNDK